MNGVARGHLARLMPDGSLDTSFLNGLSGADDYVRALLLQEDGKIVVGGEFTTFNGVTRLGIARLNADGSLDESFTNGLGGYVYALAQQSDGKIIAGGSNLARLNPDGSVDSSFPSIIGSDSVLSMALQPDGKLLIGRYSSISRVNPSDWWDNSFAASADGPVWSIAVQSDGKILIGGRFTNPRPSFARLNSNGSLDTSFAVTWAPDYVYSIALQGEGKIVAGGSGPSGLVQLNPDGSLDSSFVVGPLNGDVNGISLDRAGRMLMCGGFTAVNQSPRSFVARLIGESAPPVIVRGPQTQTAETGSSVSFAVKATGHAPLCYQWCFDGPAPINAQTTAASLQLLDLQPTHAGAYSVIVTNFCGAVTSSPAMLSVITPVVRRMVPGVNMKGQVGTLLNLTYSDTLDLAGTWASLGNVTLTNTSEFYFDPTEPLATARFYRATHIGGLAGRVVLDLYMVPALTLNQPLGSSVRIDCIDCVGPTDAWMTLATVPIATVPQLYFDTTAWGQPARLYRLTTVP